MTPSLPIPTDNIYKFACLFGLVLIVSSIFALVSVYTSSLDRKIHYAEVIIPFKVKPQPTDTEKEYIKLYEQLIEVAKKNEKTASVCVGVVLGIGVILCYVGATKWYRIIQKRDDKLANLQIKKLEAEIARINSEV
jgi:hypothetical protein